MKRMTISIAVALAAGLGLAACDVDKKQEGELPKVSVEGGQLPEYQVRGPDVEVGSTTREITVPTVTVDPPKENENEPANAQKP
jgi:hypothetical protein